MRYIGLVIRIWVGAATRHGPGLCYDTQRVEAMPFPVAMPDKTPWALS
jgi:hypothetical protein